MLFDIPKGDNSMNASSHVGILEHDLLNNKSIIHGHEIYASTKELI